MKDPIFLTEAQKVKMAQMYENGLSMRDCAKQFNVDVSTAHKWLNASGVLIRDDKFARRQYTSDELAFTHSTAESAYWLGFLLADGCIHEHKGGGSLALSVSVSQKDITHLQQLQHFLQANHPLYLEPKTNSVRLSIRSNTLCQSLISRGCIPAKSLVLEYPPSGYFHRRHFVRGYFDGDGSIYVNEKVYCQPTVSIAGTYEFLGTLQDILVSEAGITENTIRAYTHSEAKYLSYTGHRNAQKIYAYLYNEDGPFLERKKVKFEYALSYHERKGL